MILAILLGPHAGFLTLASVLVIQALFFGDGGLLALGCNIFNMGFWTCFVAYPLVYKRLAKEDFASGRLTIAAVASVMVAMQLGPLSIVIQTVVSGISELPFKAFLLLMQPIHLAIGVVEGLATVIVVGLILGTALTLFVLPALIAVFVEDFGLNLVGAKSSPDTPDSSEAPKNK